MRRPLFEYPDDEERYAANKRFSAMLAEEYILIDISLSSTVRAGRIKPGNRI
jgi:hypothetical protein